MAADQYCLKWNNHQSTLLVQFETLLESDSLTDCTLSAEGKYLNVHKVLLSACSPYFSKLLGEHKDKHPIFFMKDVAFEELKGIVEYMYKGEVNVTQERLDSFLKTASSLQIKGLADQDGGRGDDDPGGGGGGNRSKRKVPPELRGGVGLEDSSPEPPQRSPKRRRRPRPASSGAAQEDGALSSAELNHCDTTTTMSGVTDVVMPTPLVPVKKTEPLDGGAALMQLKTEIVDEPVPQVDVQDLTLDDDEDFNNDDVTQPGTSFSETSQDFAQWQPQMATQSGADETSFMAATQGMNQAGSQDDDNVYKRCDDSSRDGGGCGAGGTNWKCHKCDASYNSVNSLITHMGVCSSGLPRLDCSVCGAVFHDDRQFRMHSLFCGSFVKPKICACGKLYRYRRGLRRHQKLCKFVQTGNADEEAGGDRDVKDPRNQTSVICKRCGKNYVYLKSFLNHMALCSDSDALTSDVVACLKNLDPVIPKTVSDGPVAQSLSPSVRIKVENSAGDSNDREPLNLSSSNLVDSLSEPEERAQS